MTDQDVCRRLRSQLFERFGLYASEWHLYESRDLDPETLVTRRQIAIGHIASNYIILNKLITFESLMDTEVLEGVESARRLEEEWVEACLAECIEVFEDEMKEHDYRACYEL